MSQLRRSSPSSPAPVRVRILDAADRLLSRHGYHKMTVDDVAREAGIGKGSVYLHFASKQDVALGCLDRMAENVCARLRDVAHRTERPPRERLRDMLLLRILDRFDYASTHTHSLDDIAAVIRAAALARRAQHFDAEARILADVVRSGAGTATPGSALADARSLVLATNALLPFSLSTQELGSRSSVERAARALIELLLAGIDAHTARHSYGTTPSRTRRSSS